MTPTNEPPDVLRWYENLRRSSAATADLYLRRFRKFCSDVGLLPEELLELGDTELRNLVLDYLSDKEGSYAASFIYALRSWFEFSGRRFSVKVKLRRRRKSEEKTPTPEELGAVFSAADPKARVAAALVAFSGVRLEVIGNYDGTDGLTLGDVAELRVGGKLVDLVDEPATITVREELSKAGHRYFTYLCSEGCGYLLSWLRLRALRGEELEPDSPLVPSRGGGFLKTKSVSEMIRKAIRAADLDFRPYALRHYFDTRMLLAEVAGVIPRDYRVFWMGHRGDIEHQYTLNNHRLPEDLVQDMRLRYERAASTFLETARKTKTKARQKVVTLEELERYLEEGWKFVTALPNGKAVVKRV